MTETKEPRAQMPETLPTVNVALAAVMAEVQKVGKDSKNAQQGFNFRGIDAVMNAVGPAFRAHGIVTMPNVIDYTAETVATKNGGTMNHIILRVKYVFMGPAGDTMECTVFGEAADSGDKAMSKAHSVAYRTALLQVLTIPTGDPDPDATTYERGDAQGAPPAGAKLASDAQIKAVYGKKKALGMTESALTAALKRDYGKDHPGDLTDAEVRVLLDKMQAAIDNKADARRGAEPTAESETGDYADEPLDF